MSRAILSRLTGDSDGDTTVFRKAVENVTDPVFITDTDGEIQYVNDAFENQIGYSREEIIGKTPTVLKSGHHSDQYYERLWTTILSGEIWESETVNKRKDDSVVIVDQTIIPIMEDGDPVKFVSINHDITDAKRYESKLKERNQKLEMLNHTLRHDVKNDINIIKGLTGDAIKQIDDPEILESLEDVRNASTRIEEMASSIKTYMDIFDSDSDVKKTAVNAVSLVKSVVESRRTAFPNAEITTKYTENTIKFKGNKSLQSVIRNLINNAVQHNDKETPEISVVVAETEKTVVIQIEDNGPGIPDEMKSSLFEKEAKGNLSDGSGFGLWISKKVVTALGGKITVEDKNPTGTVFKITLPKAN